MAIQNADGGSDCPLLVFKKSERGKLFGQGRWMGKLTYSSYSGTWEPCQYHSVFFSQPGRSFIQVDEKAMLKNKERSKVVPICSAFPSSPLPPSLFLPRILFQLDASQLEGVDNRPCLPPGTLSSSNQHPIAGRLACTICVMKPGLNPHYPLSSFGHCSTKKIYFIQLE